MRDHINKIMAAVLLMAGGLMAFTTADKKPFLKTGTWRAVLQRPDGQQVVFNFTTAVVKNKQVLYVINGSERLLVDSVHREGDSLWITMPFFASRFSVRVLPDGNLEGIYSKSYGDRKQEIPFYALYGNSERYTPAAKAVYNVTGNWETSFNNGKRVEKAIGVFQQKSNGKLTGTFRTATGDYRYLEGIVSGDSLKLSGFDGGHAISFIAKLDNDSTITQAGYYSGAIARETWTAHKNDHVQLPDSYEQTKLKPGENRLSFRFPATNGDTVSIQDEKYKNKVVVVQILGSWCPNCMDETAFLSQYYKQHQQEGVEIIGLAYERSTSFADSKKALAPFQKRFAVTYPFLVTGVAVSDTLRAQKTLPQLESIKAFPTTIFIDKKGNVRKVHTGLDGPATGKYYDAFKQEFDETIATLLKEDK
ncbi:MULTISPECIES: peroxiredoxin family protein [Niastella]|uniref:TlpA family protein disulfide reductase n=1 Tax=Niastella soli TaxID=2821487 RepID=A0ABS3Z3E5_9BACT|nr:TlpA disulfide reductase family protein [Niastella soli]MBO9204692.1 TlpA family protein disulfide reductase [Niastella soli]